MQNKSSFGSALLLALLALSGCQSYDQKTSGRDASVRSGNITAMVAQANRDAELNRDNKDTVLYRLEQGAILRMAGLSEDAPAPAPTDIALAPTDIAPALGGPDGGAPVLSAADRFYTESIAAFNAAEERIQQFDEQAKVRIGAEAGALLTNQANLPYRGKDYDRIMMNTYQALNYLRLGNNDAARVELNRALQRQREAVEANARRIEEAKELAAKARAGEIADEQGRQASSYDVDQARNDPNSGAAFAAIENELNSVIRAYGDYVNPFSVFLDGLYFLHLGADASDLERARVSLQRVASMNPDNRFLPAELEAASTAATPQRVTYVLFETGTAANRDQIRIDIPVGLVTNRISYVGAAFPRLRFNDQYLRLLHVSNGLTSHRTELICSMDSVIAQDFKNEWPTILTKTLISTATKALIDAAIQNEARKQGWQAQLAAALITGIAQAAVNIADTRTWRTLPKEFQYARIDNPADGLITLSDGLREYSVFVDPDAVNVVYVKSTSPSAPLFTSTFKLDKYL